MYASFDVFDTLLTRSVGNPRAVFLLLGRSLFNEGVIDYDPQHFAYNRINAQRLALSKSSGRDVTLNQIYSELSFSLNLCEEKCEIIKNKELEIEAQVLTAVPGAIDKVIQEKKSGKKILYISDMYLPSSFIIDQLQKNGFEVNSNCYVSNEHLKTKNTGELFKHISQELSFPPSSFYHFGDNINSDFHVPRKLKWNAIHYSEIELNRFEKILTSTFWYSEGMTAAFAGASRYTRLAIDSPEEKKIVKDISASVVAPVLTGFLLWVFKRAKALGIKKLYYLSRDGQIFYKMSKVLAEKLHLDIELHYMYSSRKSWQFAALTDITEDKLKSWILKKKGFLSLEMVFNRVFHKAKDFEHILISNGLTQDIWEKDLTPEIIQKLCKIFEIQEVKQIILQTAQDQRELMVQYLDQEGLISGSPYAVVDLGWAGSSQNFLARILENRQLPKPVGFYLMLREKRLDDKVGIKEGYLVDQILRVGYYLSLRKIGALMESFCHADHGSLKQYKMINNKVVPELEWETNEKAINWGLPLIHKTCCCFCKSLLVDEKLIDPYIDVRSSLVKVLKTFGNLPEANEARAWGSLELECNTLETRWNLLSQPYTLKEIFDSFYHGRIYRPYYSWEEGSLALTSKPMKFVLKNSVKAGQLARKLMGRK
ncbi:hypothetical protein BH23BAC1_BH23BAC1_20280 [soil metagenome]